MEILHYKNAIQTLALVLQCVILGIRNVGDLAKHAGAVTPGAIVALLPFCQRIMELGCTTLVLHFKKLEVAMSRVVAAHIFLVPPECVISSKNPLGDRHLEELLAKMIIHIQHVMIMLRSLKKEELGLCLSRRRYPSTGGLRSRLTNAPWICNSQVLGK